MIPRLYASVGESVELSGYAMDFDHTIGAVQFSLDDGRNWTTYATEGTTDYQNVNWTFIYTPEEEGLYVMKIRSVNDEGKASPAAASVEILVEA